MKIKSNQTAFLGSGSKKQIWFDPKDPADRKRAWMELSGITSEEYDRRHTEMNKHIEETNAKYPALKNLVWADGEMYYTDDNGKRLSEIETRSQMNKIKEQIRESFKELAPEGPLKVTKFDTFSGDVTSVEEKDRFAMLDEELAKTKLDTNNAIDFILGIKEELQ